VLYLAEVQKKSGGFMGGGNKADLKLLACQRSEQNWSAVPGEESVPLDDAANFSPGALVLVDLTANRQVQRIQEAGRPLVSILQNFSRLQEKFKNQEEEIEQWKQSLTYQAQELNRREMEMEARREQLQQMEEDFEQMEQQRQELTVLQQEINQQKESYERNRQELEGAWEHLRGEMRRFEEQQAASSSSAGLDAEQAAQLQALLNRLSNEAAPGDVLREHVNGSFEILHVHQEQLSGHWQTVEQLRSQVQQSQTGIDQFSQEIQARWHEWQQAQDTLEQARSELKAQQGILATKEDYARLLAVNLQRQEEVHQHLYRLAENSDSVKIGLQIDVAALEKMPLGDLQKMVHDLEADLEKLSNFVESQEEELRFKQQEIDEIRSKIEAASEFDRLNLENDLSDEQDGYEMLNETLVGQRRSLQERKSVLSQHQSVLRRRQGIPDPDGGSSVIDLSPVMTQLDAARQQQTEEMQALEAQIKQMKISVQQAEELITSQSAEQENKRSELKQLEFELANRRAAFAEEQGKLNLYQEFLQPVQDAADGVRQRLEAMSSGLVTNQQNGSYEQAIAEMRQVLDSLSNAPELARS
jgi:chromosome segregation ATPase